MYWQADIYKKKVLATLSPSKDPEDQRAEEY
jgi:hypothetical protein